MLIGWSKHQVSDDPLQPSRYLLDRAVEKECAGGRGLEVRTPVPEILIGHPAVFQAALKVPKTALRYRVATLSFAVDDIDVAAFNAGDVQSRYGVTSAIDLFLEMAFAGVPPDNRPPVLVGTHTHTGRLEINIAMPRYVKNALGMVRSFNPHPPVKGSQNYWDSLGDTLCTMFGWANPRSIEQASQIKGPDWAEKRVAAADRLGQTFDPEINPRLFLLQNAKRVARSDQGRKRALFWAAFWAAIERTGYKSVPKSKGRVLFTSDKGEPLLLRGELINSPESYADKAEARHQQFDIGTLWQRRADQNSTVYSEGSWNQPAPNWALGRSCKLTELPTHHPDFVLPTQDPGALHFATLGSRAAAAIRSLRNIIARKIAALLVRRGIGSLQSKFFTTIKHQLENLKNEYPDATTTEDDEPDDRALRFIAQGLGKGGRNGYRRADRGDDGRSGRDQGLDGALYEGDGGFGADNKRDDVNERDATEDGSTARSTGRRHQMVMSAAEPARLSRIGFLRLLRRASDIAFPQDEADIQMASDGSFGIFTPRGEILISKGGNVVGRQGMAESDIIEFASALPEQAVRYLSLPEDIEGPELF